jgi:hypothetical protein
MKMVAEYLEYVMRFQSMAAAEKNLTAQAQLLQQADAYYKLAVKRAQELGQALPPRPTTTEESTLVRR